MSRSRFVLGACLYGLLILYASTIVGPVGMNFVPIDPVEAWARFLHMPLAHNGSDQRADWMGNLMMLAPFGFMMAGALSPRNRLPVWGALAALILSGAFILAVKYAQLFFPPRTVTLNYVAAQSLGAAAGVAVFGITRRSFARLGRDAPPLAVLRVFLALYTAALVLFLLEPLDFALDVEDLTLQLNKLPETFTALSGSGRPTIVRLAIMVGSIGAFVPVGMLLTIRGRGRPFVGRSAATATGLGFCVCFALYALSALTISGSPSLPSVPYRTLGVALGAVGMNWVVRCDPLVVRRWMVRLLPLAVPAYLVGLAAVNGLLSATWISPEAGIAALPAHALLPLFDYYIVTKAQAAKNIVAHAVMYVPVGVFAWLVFRSGGRGAAAVLAFLLSALVEGARLLRPGLQPDLNAVPLAAAAAWAAADLMPPLWRMLEGLTIVAAPKILPRPSASATAGTAVPGWRERAEARRARARNRDEVIGDVEDY